MSTELESQVRVSSGALEDSRGDKAGEKAGKWEEVSRNLIYSLCPWRERERERERRDRVNDCSALQSEGASEPESFFFFPSRAVIKVSDLLVPFEFSLARARFLFFSHARTHKPSSPLSL